MIVGIAFTDEMLLPELMVLARGQKPPKQYKCDQMAQAAGLEVVRLPPYHCQFNPIELAWSFLKGYVGKHNTDGKMESVERLFAESRRACSGREMWAGWERHVVKLEQQQWEADNKITEIERFIIVANVDDDTDDEEDESGDDHEEEGEEEDDEEEADDEEGEVTPHGTVSNGNRRRNPMTARRSGRPVATTPKPTKNRRKRKMEVKAIGCAICDGAEGEDEDWIGCDYNDTDWFHKRCLNPSVVNVS